MIAGIGMDITETARIQQVVEKHGQHFLNRLLTVREQQESGGRITYYAGRWAAKEAIAKALGCGLGAQCSFTDIEILRQESGRPEAVLSGQAERTAADLKISRIHLTITHERLYAAATAVLEAE